MTARKHLTPLEVDTLLKTIKQHSRNHERDSCLVLLMFRHGLRVSEACNLKLHQVDTESRIIHVQRLKKGLHTTQPLRPEEVKIIKAWLKKRPQTLQDSFFISERGAALSRITVWDMLKRMSAKAELAVTAHPHMLRHACGYALADQGADTRLIQDYLGHRNIQHTVRYTATNAARFERLWR
jgi:type 1 fimbriae regulatory protein FimB